MKEAKTIIKSKEENGITLIALVVTIVVLLILAGVTITFVLSDGGVLQKARDAANKTNNAIKYEQEDMANIDSNIQNLVNGTSSKDDESSFERVKTANQLKAGDSVLLPYNGGTIECAVLYDSKYNTENKKEYGIQIISKDTLEDNYTYKKTDPWDNYIHALNEELKKYINDSNSMYVSSVRCVGSLPDNPENTSMVAINPPDEEGMEGRDPYYDDLNDIADTEQMRKYNLSEIGKTYFLASKMNGGETSWNKIGYFLKSSIGSEDRRGLGFWTR